MARKTQTLLGAIGPDNNPSFHTAVRPDKQSVDSRVSRASRCMCLLQASIILLEVTDELPCPRVLHAV